MQMAVVHTGGVTSDLELAFELADLGAMIALPRFYDRDFTVTRKPDGSPVTEVDRGVERALRDRIAEYRSSDAVVGEEYGRTGHSDWCWYLDPIDGTSRFLRGDAKWMILIALAHRDEVVLGIVSFPALGERWWATRGHGAFHDGERITVSTTSRLSDAVVNDDSRQTLAQGIADHPLMTVAARCGSIRPHQGHSFLAVASGQADVAAGTGGFAWDYAPLKIIVEEAGGRFTDFDADPRIDARSAVVTNRTIHPQVLDALHRGARVT
jgi:histidinol-phosphatase